MVTFSLIFSCFYNHLSDPPPVSRSFWVKSKLNRWTKNVSTLLYRWKGVYWQKILQFEDRSFYKEIHSYIYYTPRK